MGRGMQPGEKPKDLKGSIGKLIAYIGSFKAAIIVVILFAAFSTVFSVIGPKILGKATTALSEGLMEKIRGTGGIDFTYIGQILLFVLGLYVCSAVFTFIQGWIMTGVTQKLCYRLRKEISEKINRRRQLKFERRYLIYIVVEPVGIKKICRARPIHVYGRAGFVCKVVARRLYGQPLCQIALVFRFQGVAVVFHMPHQKDLPSVL